MTIEEKLPAKATKEELSKLGARHLVTDELELKGKKGRIEYMVYEGKIKYLVWKKPIGSKDYILHAEADIRRKYPVPAVI